MVGILSLIAYIVPNVNDCYINQNIIDPRNSHELRMISKEIANEADVDLSSTHQKLSCIPFSKKNNSYIRTVTGTHITVATKHFQFRDRLVNDFRIKKGAEFFLKYQTILEKAENKYGVNPYIITAIIGSESNYGKFLGNASTRNALVDITLNTTANNKKNFFKKELKALITLSLQNILDIDTLKGSWDGGFGLSQFMPSNYLKYAVSDKHTSPDLFDYEDAIYSVANYLEKHNYQTCEKIVKKIDLDQKNDSINIQTNIERTDYGAYAPIGNDATTIGHIYEFQDDTHHEYWQALGNFAAIASYNPRLSYVISIHLLAEAIHETILSESA